MRDAAKGWPRLRPGPAAGRAAASAMIAAVIAVIAVMALAVMAVPPAAMAQQGSPPATGKAAPPAAGVAPHLNLEELLSAVVRVRTSINPDARTVENLGRERDGSGVVIDDSGLILTIGYLMVEAYAADVITNDGRKVPATVVGYDNDTGFGLLRALEPLKVRPMPIGKSAAVKEREPVLAASFGGMAGVAPAMVASRREFVGNWEYLVEDAFFTTPAHNLWSGAALISRDGKLVGLGSLIVGDALGKGSRAPGNMYLPIDLLPPILADLIAEGHSSAPPRPWLGISVNEAGGALVLGRVTPDSPAERAGLQKGDVISGVGGKRASDRAALYREIWAAGKAGDTIPVDVVRAGEKQRISVPSMNRLDHLKLKTTF